MLHHIPILIELLYNHNTLIESTILGITVPESKILKIRKYIWSYDGDQIE